MDLFGIPLFSLAGDKLSYLATRHEVIAENIANANTPGYIGRDLKSFESMLKDTSARMTQTQPGHMNISETGTSRMRIDTKGKSWEIVPSGNTVSMEQEMLKASDTVMSYALVSNIYKSNVKLLSDSLGGLR